MKIAIFENIMTPGGHEVDFDRILVEELKRLGHEVVFYVPEGFHFGMDYHTEVRYLSGSSVSYTHARGIGKFLISLRRSQRRFSWYRQLYQAAQAGEMDAIIVPTATYRYLRALRHSVLRRSPVPVLFFHHGITPKDAKNFFDAVHGLLEYPNIRSTVITFEDAIFGKRPKNLRFIFPPTYIPRDVVVTERPAVRADEPLTIGFFGQFRREKHLEDLLNVYLAGNYTRPVHLLVQGSTMHEEDAAEFDRIIASYEGKGITFLHRGLIGAEWQKAIASVDALLLPYSAERYRYQCSAMLFTAIGFQKPVLVSDDINPCVVENYPVGVTFQSGDPAALGTALETFINEYDVRVQGWQEALEHAGRAYAPTAFAERIIEIITENKDV
jgi:hypothetical protein